MERGAAMKALVIGAHPDDEILGVGGTILKHNANNDEVYVCIVTKAYGPRWPRRYMENKIKEQRKVDKLLGIKRRFNLGFQTTKLNMVAHGEINGRINDIVNEVNPDIIYTHFEDDLNYDHTIIFRACMVAARPPKRIRLLCFETLSETEWNNKIFLPNFLVDVSGFINKKVKAFEIYKSEVKPYPHPRSPEGIRILAKKRGLEICVEYAEAFILIKESWV